MALRGGYFFSEALSNLRRSPLMAIAAVEIVLVSLLLLGLLMVGGQLVDQFTFGFEKQVEVNVFLQEEVTPEQTKDLQTTILAMPEVKTVNYISKDQAYKEYQELYKESPELVEAVSPDALPASFRIQMHSAKSAEAVAARLEGQPGVDKAEFGGDAIRRALKVTGFLRLVVLGLTLVFLGSATALIASTIRLAIYARRREIAIMRLVGASNWFIRMPFVFEGMLEGLIGAMIATGLIVIIKVAALDNAQQSIAFLPITVGWGVILRIFAWLAGLGVAVGALGSAVGLRRFLEV